MNKKYKLRGSVTTVERMEVEVFETELIEAMRDSSININQFLCLLEGRFAKEYGVEGSWVNAEKGIWEHWENSYHGSDWTEKTRDATDEEIQIMTKLREVRELMCMKELKDK